MRLHWADYRRRPYRYKLTLHLQRSTEGKLKNRIRLSYRAYRALASEFDSKRDLSATYALALRPGKPKPA